MPTIRSIHQWALVTGWGWDTGRHAGTPIASPGGGVTRCCQSCRLGVATCRGQETSSCRSRLSRACRRVERRCDLLRPPCPRSPVRQGRPVRSCNLLGFGELLEVLLQRHQIGLQVTGGYRVQPLERTLCCIGRKSGLEKIDHLAVAADIGGELLVCPCSHAGQVVRLDKAHTFKAKLLPLVVGVPRPVEVAEASNRSAHRQQRSVIVLPAPALGLQHLGAQSARPSTGAAFRWLLERSRRGVARCPSRHRNRMR